MELKSIKYAQKTAEREWEIFGANQEKSSPVEFGKINLIVGTNSSGKSRTLRAIYELAMFLSGDMKISQTLAYGEMFDVAFWDDANLQEIRYYLKFENAHIIKEELKVNGEVYIERNEKKSQMRYESIGSMVDFQADADMLAVARRDRIQHSYLISLAEWGANMSYYLFGKDLGQGVGLKSIEIDAKEDFDLRNSRKVAGIFKQGVDLYDGVYKQRIIDDLKKIGYTIEDIKLEILRYSDVPVYGLSVQENGLKATTDQSEMSQGMFRALSLLIQINYALYSGKSSCIMIDDIGEGLDYHRSTELIQILVDKAKLSHVQLLMTTNDRFVMNNVPLEFWQVIRRDKGEVYFYNTNNSPEQFKQFDFYGLNNFEFFASNLFLPAEQ